MPNFSSLARLICPDAISANARMWSAVADGFRLLVASRLQLHR